MKNNMCYVITNPMIATNRSAEVTLSKFLRVISAVYDEIHVVGGNLTIESDVNATLHTWHILRAKNKVKRLFDIVLLQLKMAIFVLKNTQREVPVYFWLGDKMLLPYLAAKIKKMNIRYFVYSNVLKEGTPSLFSKMSGRLIVWMANNADSVCIESPSVIDEWDGSIRNKKIRIIHLYTNFREMACVSERENIIGMVCRLTECKHPIESIKAFFEIHKKYPDYKLEIVGTGRLESACKELIYLNCAEDYIRLLGWVEHKKIFDITSKWKYLLTPTDAEGLPNNVIEMMGQGIPVIASPISGIRDVVIDGKNGWYISSPTVTEIVDGIQNVIDRQAIYSYVANQARETIISRFSLKAAQLNAKRSCI